MKKGLHRSFNAATYYDKRAPHHREHLFACKLEKSLVKEFGMKFGDEISELLIERMTMADKKAALALDQKCFSSADTFDADMIEEYLTDPKTCLNLCIKSPSGKLIAFIICEAKQKRSTIETLDIDPRFRRMGLAERLTKEAIKRLSRNENIKRIYLQVNPKNAKAIALYEKLGFRFQKRLKNFYPLNGRTPQNAHDGFQFVKELK